MENQELINEIKKLHVEMKEAHNQALAEVKAQGFASPEIKSAMAKMEADIVSLTNRVVAAEQKSIAPMQAKAESKSIGQQFVETESFRLMAEGKSRQALAEIKATYTSPSQVAPIVATPQGNNIFAFQVRNYLGGMPIQTDLVKVPQETTTQAATVKTIGSAAAETTTAITMVDTAVRTVAHFTSIAKEFLADAPAFGAFVDQRMAFGIRGAEETQLLIGDGTGQNLKGLVPYATTKTFTTEAMIDRIALSVADALATGYVPTFVVVAPVDYGKLVTAKASTSGNYLLGSPAFGFAATIWGVPVVPSPKMTANNFLVGSGLAASVAERQGTTLSLSYEHASNFTSGIVTVMAEQREALMVFAPGAFITGVLS
ncbi:phage major capsid protein [Paludibaculum fermentans]|uniref:phage major capsid protein n=1 Tax=Paludibaculum fermentans TaxID=1473598 RepID=UPI003EB89F63